MVEHKVRQGRAIVNRLVEEREAVLAPAGVMTQRCRRTARRVRATVGRLMPGAM
jgi:hypothetical protein